MLHISICDDDEIMRNKMEQLMMDEMIKQRLEVNISTYSNGAEFLEQYQNRNDELIILDIDTPVKSGIDVIRELERFKKNKNIILVTSYDHLVLDSLEYRPFQIIRKVKLEKDLPKSLWEYLEKHRLDSSKLEISYRGKVQHVLKKDIEYVEKYRNDVIMHLTNRRCHTIYSTLKKIEPELVGSGFIRISVGCIVNIQHISFIQEGKVEMKSGARISVSRDKIKMVKEQYMIGKRL